MLTYVKLGREMEVILIVILSYNRYPVVLSYYRNGNCRSMLPTFESGFYVLGEVLGGGPGSACKGWRERKRGRGSKRDNMGERGGGLKRGEREGGEGGREGERKLEGEGIYQR